MGSQARRMLSASFVLLATVAGAAGAEGAVPLPQGTAIVADGAIGDVEWQDAKVLFVELSSTVRVKVLAKHDGANLLAAFLSDWNPSRTLFMPEICIDTAFERATAWQPDDWWFHVSASDCNSSGRWNDYSNCLVVQPDWLGVPNYPMNDPSPDLIESFEISVPLAKLGLAPGSACGLAFSALFITEVRAIWPGGAAMSQPASWAEAMLCDGECPVSGSSPMSYGQVKALYR